MAFGIIYIVLKYCCLMRDEKFFASNYSKCWDFFCESKWFIVFALGIFALTFLIGFAFPIFFRAEIFVFIEEMILEFEGKGAIDGIVYIFLNNLLASFFAMALGVFLGVFSFMTCVVNGYLLGFVSRSVVEVEGIFVLWRLLPHGIFELPAILFSIGIGLRLGAAVASGGQFRVGNKKNRGVGYVFREGLRFFVFVIFPLLILAGIIEGLLISFM